MTQFITTRLSDRSMRQRKRRGEGFLQKQRLIVYWIENTSESSSSSSLIDVCALEGDVIQRLSFDGRVYVCKNVLNGPIRERTIGPSASSWRVIYLLLVKYISVMVIRCTNGKILLAFFAHFDVNLNRTDGRSIAAAIRLAGGWRSTRITDHFIFIFVVTVQISRID